MANDFTLRSTSPAKDAGVVIAGINQVISGPGPDIGAFETIALDYTLRSNSPARNAGTLIAGINQIVLGSAPDLGAFEYADPVVIPPSSRPIAGSVAEELYRRMGPVTDQDEKLGWPLLRYITAFCSTYLQEIDDLSSDKANGQPGWASILDPDQTPSTALGWLAQFVGVRINPSLTNAQNIPLIKEPVGFQRGSPNSIKAAITPYMTGTKTITLTERYLGNAYQVLVTTLAGEVPNVAAMQAAALSQKPAGILMLFTAPSGQTYSQLRTAQATYTAARTAYATYTAMRSG